MPDSRFFKRKTGLTFETIQALTGCRVQVPVNSDEKIENLVTLLQAGESDLSFYHNDKYRDALIHTKAKMILCSEDDIKDIPAHAIPLIVDDPYQAYAKLANELYSDIEDQTFSNDKYLIHPSVTLGKNVIIEPGVMLMANVEIGDNTKIGAYTVIRSGVVIGSNCLIASQCVISHSIIGNNVTCFPGVKIGQAGFGFVMGKQGHFSVPQLGRVIIEDKVEIGANATIDRGTLKDTVIGYGTRIDNLVQIGHGVTTGKNCVIVALVGIAGSTELGNNVILAGQVGIAGHLKIGNNAIVAAKSGVLRDIAPDEIMAGIPAVPIKQWHRQTVMMAKMARINKDTK